MPGSAKTSPPGEAPHDDHRQPCGGAARPLGGRVLSPREREILELLAKGLMYKEIAQSLGIGVVTVNTHVRRIYKKLRVRSRGQAVAKYVLKPLQEGVAPPATPVG